MPTREQRLADFDNEGVPPADVQLELLCQDNSGTYRLPFPCAWHEGRWTNMRTGEAIDATVVGWRAPRGR